MLTIGFKEILVIAAIIGALIWMRMFRTKMDQETTNFFRKLKGAKDGQGFGWKGLLIAFLVGIICCWTFGLMVFRIWSYYHPGAGV